MTLLATIRAISRNYSGLLILILLTFLLDLFFISGFYASDDKSYLLFADELINGHLPMKMLNHGYFAVSNNQIIDFGPLRLLISLPLTFVYWISNGNIFFISLYFIFLHLVIVLITFRLTMLISSKKAAYFAAVFTATSPVFYIFSGGILPDSTELIFILLSVYFLINSKNNLNKDSSLPGRSREMLIFLAGLMLALAYAARISALIFYVPIVIYLVMIQKKMLSLSTVRTLIIFMSGLAIILTIETIIYRVLFGEFFTRFGIIAGMKDHYLMRAAKQGITISSRFDMLESIFLKIYYGYQVKLLVFISLVSIIIARKQVLIISILIWGVLYKFIGTTNFSTYAPPVLQARYFSFAFPLIAILIGISFHFIWLNIKDRLDRNIQVALIIFVLGSLFSVVIVNIGKNLPSAGKIYRAPLVKSTEKAYDYIANKFPESTIVMADSSRFWLYPEFFTKAALERFPKLRMEPGNNFPYYIIGAVEFEPGSKKFWSGFENQGHAYNLEFIDIINPDKDRPKLVLNYITNIFKQNTTDDKNLWYSSNSTFILKVDTLLSQEGENGYIFDKEFFILYPRSEYQGLQVEKSIEGIIVEWTRPFDRKAVISSFDYGLKYQSPYNKFFSALDSTAKEYEFAFGIKNESAHNIRIECGLYLYTKEALTYEANIPIEIDANGTYSFTYLVPKEDDLIYNNYRIHLLLDENSGQNGKFLFSDFHLKTFY